MSHTATARRTVAASLALTLSALGVTAVAAPAAVSAMHPTGAQAISGTDADAAFGDRPHQRHPRTRLNPATPRTAPASSAANTGTGTAPDAPGAKSYTFATLLDDKPVRWNPCTDIHWSSSLTGAPAGALQVLQDSVATIARATGTTWTYDGPTSTNPTSDYLPTRSQSSYPPVLIGYTDGAHSDLLDGQPQGVLAMTRTAWFGIQKADGSKVAATRAGVIALDRSDKLPLTGPVSWSAVVLHELAHTMGLGHTDDPTQLLAPVLPRSAGTLQNGDRNGLVRLGADAGCVIIG